MFVGLLALRSAADTSADPVTITVDPRQLDGSQKVPPSYLGLSLEPINQTRYYASDEVFTQLLKNLVSYRTGPINIRLGGDTQDDPVGGLPMGNEHWEELLSLRDVLKGEVVYTVPINLRSGTAKMAVEQVQTMRDSGMQPEVLYALAVGNEPNLYKDMPTKWFPSGGYYDRVLEFMKAVQPMLQAWGVGARVLSGPAIAYRLEDFPTVNVPEWAKLGEGTDGGPFTKLLTWHYYTTRATSNEATIGHILAQNMGYIKVRHSAERYARAAHAANLTFRIDETNSISHSGTFGVSNTMAAALWLVDHALGLMQVGTDGINLHGAGCSPYSPIVFPGACKYATMADQLEKFRQMCPSAGTCLGEARHENDEQEQEDEQAPAEVNAPYLGMLFVQRALRNHQNLTMLGPEAIKVVGGHTKHLAHYTLRSPKQLRVVLINKHDKANGPLKVQVAIKGPTDWGVASVQYLLADQLSSTAPDITVAGMHVNATTGQLQLHPGTMESCKVKPIVQKDSTVYSLELPPASATVLVLPHRSFLGKKFDELLNQVITSQSCGFSSS